MQTKVYSISATFAKQRKNFCSFINSNKKIVIFIFNIVCIEVYLNLATIRRHYINTSFIFEKRYINSDRTRIEN